MAPPKVLFVLTSHNKMGNTGNPTGWYLVRFPSPLFLSSPCSISNLQFFKPEFAHPYEVLAPHVSITIASPLGGAAPLDPSSVEASKSDAVSTKFLAEKKSLWENTAKLSDFLGHAGEYEAIFFVGGHGRMFSFPFLEAQKGLGRQRC